MFVCLNKCGLVFIAVLMWLLVFGGFVLVLLVIAGWVLYFGDLRRCVVWMVSMLGDCLLASRGCFCWFGCFFVCSGCLICLGLFGLICVFVVGCLWLGCLELVGLGRLWLNFSF